MSEIEPNTGTPDEPDSTRVSRRGLVGGLAIGAGVVGAGLIGGAAASALEPSSYRKQRLVVDVACLADQWTESKKWDTATDDDFRAPFLVEGWIYPEGTIERDGFVPVDEGTIGRWFCRGYGIGTTARGEPHVNSHQDFVFGVIGGDQLFPDDMISTSGIEGTGDRTKVAKRAIIGGTGKYLGATGQVFQQFIAWNTSTFPGATDSGFSWRMTFDLRVLD